MLFFHFSQDIHFSRYLKNKLLPLVYLLQQKNEDIVAKYLVQTIQGKETEYYWYHQEVYCCRFGFAKTKIGGLIHEK